MSLELEKVENITDILNMIEIANSGFRITNIDLLIQEFMNTEQQVMEIKWKGTYKSAQAARYAFRERIKKLQYHASVARVKDRLYLLNLERS